MTDRAESEHGPTGWVNAVLTVTIPLDDISPDESREAKEGALTLAMEDLIDALGSRWGDAVFSATCEDVRDDA